MKLVDMSHEPGEGMPEPYTPCAYPCGLTLRLGEPELKKLKLPFPEAGTTLRVEAVAVVTRASQEDPDADGDVDFICVELQVVKLGVQESRGEAEDEEEEEENPVDRRNRKARTIFNNTLGKKGAKASE